MFNLFHLAATTRMFHSPNICELMDCIREDRRAQLHDRHDAEGALPRRERPEEANAPPLSPSRNVQDTRTVQTI